jgi:hypothetical protein
LLSDHQQQADTAREEWTIGYWCEQVGQTGGVDAWSSAYLPSSARVAPEDVSVSCSRMDGNWRTTAAGVAQNTSPSGPETGTSSR